MPPEERRDFNFMASKEPIGALFQRININGAKR